MGMLEMVLSQIGINKTFFFQFALVIVSYFILSRFLFRPILRIMINRGARTDDLKRKADELLLEYEKSDREYERRWSDYVKKADEEKQKIYSKTNTEVTGMIQGGDRQAHEYVMGSRLTIDKNMKTVKGQLNGFADEIKKDIKTRLLDN